MKDNRPFAVRWPDFISVEGDCWVWTGHKGRGYGQTSEGRGNVFFVHRRVYELLVGPIPVGREMDHLCRNRACCNPDHLQPVIHVVNVRRGAAGAKERAATHCKRGHEFSDENTGRTKAGARECIACRRVRAKERMRKVRGSIDPKPNAEKTHCKHGHEFTRENTYLNSRGSRCCRACTNEQQRRYQARKRMEA